MGVILAAVLGAFVTVVAIDLGSGAGDPPGGVEEFEVASRDHTEEAVSYEQSPPVGGDHNPVWQNAGFYEEPVRNENAVHALEHGAVWVAYNPDLPQEGKEQMREIAAGQECVVASPYPGLDAPIVASAWGKQLPLESAGDPTLDRFVSSFLRGPQTPEPGAACTGGIGAPS